LAAELPEVKVAYTQTSDDFKKAFLQSYYSNKIVIMLHSIMVILSLLIILFIVLSVISEGFVFERLLLVIFTFVIVIIALCRPLFVLNIINRQWATSKLLPMNIEASISTIGMTVSSFSGINTFKWEHIYRILETKDFYLIYLNVRDYRVLPKRVVDAKQQKIIRLTFLNNIGPRVRIVKRVLKNEKMS